MPLSQPSPPRQSSSSRQPSSIPPARHDSEQPKHPEQLKHAGQLKHPERIERHAEKAYGMRRSFALAPEYSSVEDAYSTVPFTSKEDCEYLPLHDSDISRLPHEHLPLALLHRERLLPLLEEDGVLHIGCDKHLAPDILARLRFVTGKNFVQHIIDTERHNKWLAIYARLNGSTNVPITDESTVDETPAHFLEKLVQQCLLLRGSDIHFEPDPTYYQIRIRIDGRLRVVDQVPHQEGERCLLRLKLLAGMDIAESRLPQDGALVLTIADQSDVSFRVATLATIHGEKLTLRLINADLLSLQLDHLGMSLHQVEQVKKALTKNRGLILVCGPTGSGKTSTLYSALMQIDRKGRHVISAENPVEHHLPGVQQVQIEPKAGLTFATALRAFLRQDPDVIMIGEIRDEETADITLKAVQTGHLVIATVHAASVYGCWARLRQLGIVEEALKEMLSLVIAQRLVPALCVHCRGTNAALYSEELYSEEHHYQVREALPQTPLLSKTHSHAECPHCYQGRSGRIGLFDMGTPPFHFPKALSTEAALAGLKQAGMALVSKGMVASEDLMYVL
ncbi:hypothetical protein LMG33818_000564 [Halomonadaceae bacterium LMG 33818]